MSRLLSREDLERIHTHPALRAMAALDRGDVRSAELMAIRLSTYHFQLYFGYLHWIARMLGQIHRRHGFSVLHLALRESILVWLDPVLRSFETGDYKMGVERLVTSWKSEMGTLEVHEDSRRFVIVKKPCGSGGRLFLEGWHGRLPEAYSLVEDRIPAEGKRKPPFPPFCAACHVCGELFEERLGDSMISFTNEPGRIGNPCTIEVRKRAQAAAFEGPDSARGNRTSDPALRSPSPSGLLFSEAELRDLGRPLMDRAIDALRSERLDEARRLFEGFPDEWRVLHDDLVRWSASLLTFIHRKWGVEGLEESLTTCYDPVFRTAFDLMRTNDDKTNIEYLADVLHSHYMRNFQCVEEGDRIVFRLDLCGSGGVLVRDGAYGPPQLLARVTGRHRCTFSMESLPIYCTHCASTNGHQIDHGGPFGFFVRPGNALRKETDPEYASSSGCEFIYFKGLKGDSLEPELREQVRPAARCADG